MARVLKKASYKNKITFNDLHKWNLYLAALHFIQGAVILIISKSRAFPVTTNYLTLNPLSSSAAGHPVLVAATRHLFDFNIAYLIAAFFFISAIAHTYLATAYRSRYEADLKKGINRIRWIEYGFSAGLMMVAIAFLSGAYDLSTIVMIFSLTLIMNLLGLLMEVHNHTTKSTSWLSYIIGCFAGIIPWVVFVIYVIGSGVFGSGNIPTFVYWIYVSMFIFFSSFAVNMYLQYKKKGKWADYLYGERTYMILSLVAKTLLAWQVFAGILRP